MEIFSKVGNFYLQKSCTFSNYPDEFYFILFDSFMLLIISYEIRKWSWFFVITIISFPLVCALKSDLLQVSIISFFSLKYNISLYDKLYGCFPNGFEWLVLSRKELTSLCSSQVIQEKKHSSNPIGLFRCKWIIAKTHAISINSLRKHK